MATLKLGHELPGGKAYDAPAIAGTCSGDVLICGSARCLWDDLDALGDFPGDTMAINEGGLFLPRKPDHWVSLHGEHFQWWLPIRAESSLQQDGTHIGKMIQTHSNRKSPGVSVVWPGSMLPTGDGGSGLAAIRIAFLLGYSRVVLAGMPLDDSGYFYSPPSAKNHNYLHFLGAFRGAAKHEFRDRVRSMSGHTRDLLGAP